MMTFDLLGSIELTASAAAVVAVLALNLGETARARVRLALMFAAWFAAVAILAATGALGNRSALGLPGLGLAVLAPIAVLALAAARAGPFRRALEGMPLATLIGVNAVRVLGINFVLLHAAGRLPAPFAPVAGWGDIVVGLAALPVAWLARTNPRAARGAILGWNTLGLADLVAAIGLGVTSAPGPLQLIHVEPTAALMTTLPWLLIPAFLVPLLAATHLAVFYRLLALRTESAGAMDRGGGETEWKTA